MRFMDRQDAGERLAARLGRYAGTNPVVLALPRGGVPVAAEVALRLGGTLDVLVVRKLGAPFQPELGLGALAEGGVRYVDHALCRSLGVSDEEIDEIAAREAEEIERRVVAYRGGRALPDLAGRVVIVIDDGVATGGTARAAIAAVRAQRPARVIFAVPVAAAQTAIELRREVDELVAVQAPEDLYAIGLWYADFRQVDDATVRRILDEHHAGGVEQPAP